MAQVDVKFRLTGKSIPVDHGYLLFSAITELVPELHGREDIGVHPVYGQLEGNRCMAIQNNSFLTIRLPVEEISMVLPIAGKVLRIGEHEVRVGVPNTQALVPGASLRCRLAVIKGFMEPEPFLEAARQQLIGMEIGGRPSLISQPQIAEINRGKNNGSHSPYVRRTLKIHDKEVVGFALRVEELTADESIKLQEKGVGGRRRFGCGIFVVDRS